MTPEHAGLPAGYSLYLILLLTDIMVLNPSDRSSSRGATYKEYATSKPITDFAVSLIRLLCPEYLSDYYLPPFFSSLEDTLRIMTQKVTMT
jgi:hypothetical protein